MNSRVSEARYRAVYDKILKDKRVDLDEFTSLLALASPDGTSLKIDQLSSFFDDYLKQPDKLKIDRIFYPIEEWQPDADKKWLIDANKEMRAGTIGFNVWWELGLLKRKGEAFFYKPMKEKTFRKMFKPPEAV
ncbi:MAG: hypothetical protein V4691_02050 [Pseudomonadota bacterium]